MRLTRDGKFGINTQTPNKLHEVGDANNNCTTNL